ncbi:MAG: YCF48-related protein [Acidobacteriota bacterium]
MAGHHHDHFLTPNFDLLGQALCKEGTKLYAGGLDGMVVYSLDGGETWEKAETDSEESLYGIGVRGEEGWAVGDEGSVLETSDGGRSWHKVQVPEQSKLFWLGTVSLVSSTGFSGYGAGAGGLLFRIVDEKLSW